MIFLNDRVNVGPEKSSPCNYLFVGVIFRMEIKVSLYFVRGSERLTEYVSILQPFI